MNLIQRRAIAFAGTQIVIEYSGAQAGAIIDFLFCAVPPADPGSLPVSHTTYHLYTSDLPARLTLQRDTMLLYEGDSTAICAELLLGDVCHQLADDSSGGLVFHAAAVAWRDRGLLLPGTIGAGKTTLAAWLATQGFAYLTDELVWVPHDSVLLHAFTRPLNLKFTARSLWKAHLDAASAQVLSSPQGDLIAPTLFNPTNIASTPAIHLIIFPRYAPDADFTLSLLRPAQAGLKLMQCLVNARNLTDYGLADVARLARRARAYTLSYSAFDQLGERIQALFDNGPQSQ
jgi:hypothetical protein